MHRQLAILLLSFLLPHLGQAEEAQLRYRIEAKTFESGEADIRKVLDYTARPLWKHFPGYKVEPMLVTKSNSGPIVIYQRNARQEIVVKLDTHGTYWSQYAYQWAHELCHVLLDQWAEGASDFVPRWFHEGLAQELTEAAYVDTKEVNLAILANTDRLIPFYLLRQRFPSHSERLTQISYAQSLSFVSYLRRQVGLQPLLDAARRCGADRAFGRPFYDVVGRPLVYYEQRWRDEVRQHALLRLLRENCFSILLILSLPLLILAGMQRWQRERVRREQLAAEDRAWVGAQSALPTDREPLE